MMVYVVGGVRYIQHIPSSSLVYYFTASLGVLSWEA